jgi:hypothetical protein
MFEPKATASHLDSTPFRHAKAVATCPLLGDSHFGTSVWTGRALQAECDDLEMIGLALLYPALERSFCACGHQGYLSGPAVQNARDEPG